MKYYFILMCFKYVLLKLSKSWHNAQYRIAERCVVSCCAMLQHAMLCHVECSIVILRYLVFSIKLGCDA